MPCFFSRCFRNQLLVIDLQLFLAKAGQPSLQGRCPNLTSEFQRPVSLQPTLTQLDLVKPNLAIIYSCRNL